MCYITLGFDWVTGHLESQIQKAVIAFIKIHNWTRSLLLCWLVSARQQKRARESKITKSLMSYIPLRYGRLTGNLESQKQKGIIAFITINTSSCSLLSTL